MKDAKGRFLYVGKAQNLKSRINQYFSRTPDGRPSVPFIVARAESLEWIVTNTEKEALLLENTLIKKHSPRYNVRLSDDKTYLSLKIDLDDDFPRVEVTRIRSKPKDGALYFGPYSSALAIRQTLKYLQKYFPLRTCSNIKMCRQQGRPCLDYQIGRCSGPCVGLISKEDYRKIVDEVVLFLRGRTGELIGRLENKMKQQAEELKFEEAQKTRDAIFAIRQSIEKQQVYSTKWSNQDVYGLYHEGDEYELVIMHIRDGLLHDTQTEGFSGVRISKEELISGFLSQIYEEGNYIPEEIVIPVELPDIHIREEILSERKGSSVKIITPKRGEKIALIEMANKNAVSAFELKRDRDEITTRSLKELQQKLRLKKLPERIECFDISTIQGGNAVGSMAVFTGGKPDKAEYRKYRIKTVTGQDDYSMMKEIIGRRIRRGLDERKFPDLMVIDGGKGQLNIAMKVLKEFGAQDIPVISIAKDKSEWREDKQPDEKIYAANTKDAVRFHHNSSALFLIQQIRDEAHRFAITYHKKLRKKTGLTSVLDGIPGIGAKRKKTLLTVFGSLKRIQGATLDELSSVKGMSRKSAEQLFNSLKTMGRNDKNEVV